MPCRAPLALAALMFMVSGCGGGDGMGDRDAGGQGDAGSVDAGGAVDGGVDAGGTGDRGVRVDSGTGTDGGADAGGGTDGGACTGFACPLPYLSGVSLAGAEFTPQTVPGALGTHYAYPTEAGVDYFMGQGMRAVRVPFL